ncbi:MAG: hypothetical protein H0U44_07775 [Flavisolibacter sp.]|jgi:hypothetical protein|nr:hypothetical protein [Flavisolibacter sp.]
MKNTFFLFVFAFSFALSVNAQSTVDSIAAKYRQLPMPEAITIDKAFPVLGTYQLNNSDAPSEVVITIDSLSKGIVWVEGLPQGKFKAYLKQSPATYRIVAQKTGKGTQLAEGTLFLDQETNTLQIAIGKAFDNANPTAVFALAEPVTEAGTEVKVKTKSANAKSKVKIQFYSATKATGVKEADEVTSSL